MVPVWQLFGPLDPEGVQAAPLLHGTQLPLPSHTWPEPHEVPGETLVWVPPHVSVPLPHCVVPCTQGLMLQTLPATHAMQFPLPSHTCPEPQPVPGDAFEVNWHVDVPVWQVVLPLWQGVPFGLQATPA
jgi:hypothetical protein